MPDRFCIDVIFVMSHLQEKCLSVEGYLYQLFIDVKMFLSNSMQSH